MSAIYGLAGLDGRPITEDELTRMGVALAPYGPDGMGTWCVRNVGLGQRLLISTYEDRFERQPVVTCDGRQVLVSDARIDNRPELMEELGVSASEAAELPDSVFIIRAWDRWGVDCAAHLIGSFAFALYDSDSEALLLARSTMGERSLYFHETPRLLVFASAPRGLFALPFVRRQVDPQTIADYLVFAPREPGSSFFLGIRSLQPGHSMLVRRGDIKTYRHQGVALRSDLRFKRDSEYVEAFTALFDRVIADQARSAAPAGVSMSGGLDSASVAASAAALLAKRGERLKTFTEVPREGFQGPLPAGRYADETPFVQAMANKYRNLEPHFVHSGGKFYLDCLDRFFEFAETPLRNASNWPWIQAILEVAQQKEVRTLLTGAPGNLTVSWTGDGLLPSLLQNGAWLRAWREARALAFHAPHRSTTRLLMRAILPLLPDRGSSTLHLLRSGGRSGPAWRRHSPVRVEFAREQRVEERALDNGHDFRFRASPRERALNLVQRADARSDARRGQEAMFGIQKRDPTVDIRLVEFCLSIPEDQYLRDGEDRWLIRRAMATRLPAEIVNNRRRGLQAADWLHALRSGRSRLMAELDAMEKSDAINSAIDLPRLRRLTSDLDYMHGGDGSAIADYRIVLELGVTMGRFLRWAEGRLPT